MKVLLLSPYPEKIIPALQDVGDSYLTYEKPIDLQFCIGQHIDFIVSYGYRYIISESILSSYLCRAINLHISMLPHARGAHPTFWTIFDNLPLGVTIHLIDAGLDTGNILVQKELSINYDHHTFASIYKLQNLEMTKLFNANWKYLRDGGLSGWRQNGPATLHRSYELKRWIECMPNQWETPISVFKKLVKKRIVHLSYDMQQ